MTTNLPTCGELERELTQRIRALYRQYLGYQPSQVFCHLFADKLVLIIEGSLTDLEKFLLQEDQDKLVFQLRSTIDRVIKPHLISLIESVLSIAVVDLMLDTTLEREYAGAIAFLSATPEVRNPQVIPKTKKRK